jgi:hypothetical protein
VHSRWVSLECDVSPRNDSIPTLYSPGFGSSQSRQGVCSTSAMPEAVDATRCGAMLQVVPSSRRLSPVVTVFQCAIWCGQSPHGTVHQVQHIHQQKHVVTDSVARMTDMVLHGHVEEHSGTCWYNASGKRNVVIQGNVQMRLGHVQRRLRHILLILQACLWLVPQVDVFGASCIASEVTCPVTLSCVGPRAVQTGLCPADKPPLQCACSGSVKAQVIVVPLQLLVFCLRPPFQQRLHKA